MAPLYGSARRAVLWSIIKSKSHTYQIILFILLPLLVLFQLTADSPELHPITASYFESTKVVRNPALESLANKDTFKAVLSREKPYKLTVCAVVHNEVPYLVEWIEFHRLQGVDHFVLYNYFGKDLVEYMPMLYEPYNVTIRVLPARFFGKDSKDSNFYETAELAMVNCYVRYQKQSQWILLASGGHFVFSPKYSSVWEYLQKNGTEATAVRIPTVKFGTSGRHGKFRTWLSPNSYTGSVDLLYEPQNSANETYPLVLTTNTLRAPHRLLDEEHKELEDCRPEDRKRAVVCSHTSHVTLINGNRYCTRSNMSECLSPQHDVVIPAIDELRADDHSWHSTTHILELVELGIAVSSQYQILDSSWYSRIEDTLKSDQYSATVEQQVMALQPKVFVELGRECDEAAVTRGQQMMCPASHPYPYGVFGVKHLKTCCQEDRDSYNHSLTVRSDSCWNDSYVECAEPVDVQKWAHRSCCVYKENDRTKISTSVL